MTSETRTVLRFKQDFLRMLAVDMKNFDESLAVVEGGPKLSQLTSCVYPEWEYAVDLQIRELSAQLNVGVPDFTVMASRMAA